MKLLIDFPELAGFAQEAIKKPLDLTLSCVDNKTIKVSMTNDIVIPIVGITKSVTTSIDLTIEKLDGEDLYVTYDEGFRNNPLVNGLLAFLPKWEVGAVELYQRSKAIVHLAKIEQAHEALKKVEIKDIHFEEDLMLVDFELKKG